MFLIFPLFIVALVLFLATRQGRGRNALLSNGILGRGLILEASRASTEALVGTQRFEVRSLVLDIEIPGREPYEVRASPLIPRACEALPGAVLDVRVDRKNPLNIAVVGPAGSSSWLPVAASMPGQTWAGAKPLGPSKGCFITLIVLLGAGILFALLVIRSETHPKPVHTAPARVTPTPAKPPHPGGKPGTRAK